MIKISLTGLAQYIASSPAAQRKILQDFKYPAGDEAFAKRIYYREASDCLKSYVRNRESKEWLRQHALLLTAPRDGQTTKSARRLQQNADAVLMLDRYFGGKVFELLPRPRFQLSFSNVSISVAPDLLVREHSTLKFIKVQFGAKKALPEASIRVITQCMLEAAHINGHSVLPASVVYVDLARDTVHLARPGKKVLKDIQAACETISQIWDNIPKPAPSKRKSAA